MKHFNRLRVAWYLLSAVALPILTGAVLLAWQRAELKGPEPTPLLLDRHGRFLAQLGSSDEHGYGYWPLDPLPPRVVAATLALEDRRFWWHPGVDPLAVIRAAWQNLRSGRRISGASTLAMQVARMQHPGPRSYPHKALEALTALFLTLRYGREAVLGHYLKRVPYGNRVHSIAYAARYYLDKPVEDLSWAEIAFLAAIPQAPSRMNPLSFRGRQRAIGRGERILDALYNDGILKSEEWELARAQIGRLFVTGPQPRPKHALHAILKLEGLLAAQKPPDPLIRTSLDLALQAQVSGLARQALARWEIRGAGNLAVIVQRRETREVLAWLGSADYFDAARAGAIDFAQVRRPAGSTLKPFLYGLALDRGHITPGSVLEDLRYVGSGIQNADRRFLGPLLPRQALANSRNVPAVGLLRTIGIDEGYLLFQELGLHDGERPARYYGLGLAVGGLPTTLERLAEAYGVLANEGLFGEAVWYRQQPVRLMRRVMSPESARLITLFLADPQARLPSFPRMGTTEYPFPVAVKTGTSQGYRDAWTVAFSRDYLVGVWVGRPDGRSMDRLGGAESAAELARAILLHLHRDLAAGMADLSFPPPRGYAPRGICARPGDAVECQSRFVEWFSSKASSSNDSVTPAGKRLDTKPVKLSIVAPQDGLRLLRNPAVPDALNTLALELRVEPAVGQVLWYVNEKPYRLAEPPFTVRWPLQPGTHTFQARLPYRPEASEKVTIWVE